MPDQKICETCGRVIEWRKKWADDWENVRYCSKRCRGARPNATDRALEEAILAALDGAREVALADAVAGVPADGRGGMRERGRQAARRLVNQGRIRLYQKGKEVDPSTAKGALDVRAR
jgi:hypothetical protein